MKTFSVSEVALDDDDESADGSVISGRIETNILSSSYRWISKTVINKTYNTRYFSFAYRAPGRLYNASLIQGG